jgi:hypothetical protein
VSIVDRRASQQAYEVCATRRLGAILRCLQRRGARLIVDFEAPIHFGSIDHRPDGDLVGQVDATPAQQVKYPENVVISTDPPYYDNIPYADLSDFFYVWLRRALAKIYPDLFRRIAVPKNEELVATSYRHGGKNAAEAFFMDGMRIAFWAAKVNDAPVVSRRAPTSGEGIFDRKAAAIGGGEIKPSPTQTARQVGFRDGGNNGHRKSVARLVP